MGPSHTGGRGQVGGSLQTGRGESKGKSHQEDRTGGGAAQRDGDSLLWGGGANYWGFPDSSAGKESACNAGDLGLIPGLGSSPGEGNGCPLQYSGLENSMDCVVPGVAKSRT